MHSSEHGPIAVGASGTHYLSDGRVEGEDPLAVFSPHAADHLRRTDGFPHVADIMINSFYDPDLDQGCAFEELISFHGGLGGPQTRPFVLYPVELPVPEEPIVGAAGVHGLLTGWRRLLQGEWRSLPGDSVKELGAAPDDSPVAPAVEPQRPPVRPGPPPSH